MKILENFLLPTPVPLVFRQDKYKLKVSVETGFIL